MIPFEYNEPPDWVYVRHTAAARALHPTGAELNASDLFLPSFIIGLALGLVAQSTRCSVPTLIFVTIFSGVGVRLGTEAIDYFARRLLQQHPDNSSRAKYVFVIILGLSAGYLTDKALTPTTPGRR